MSTVQAASTRCHLVVQQRKGLSAADVEEILERESGLLGLTDKSGDLRHVIDAADAGTPKRALLRGLRVQDPNQRCRHVRSHGGNRRPGVHRRSRRGIHPAASRHMRGLSFLGVRLLATTNEGCTGDGVVSPSDASPAVIVVEAREDIEIVRHVRELLA